MSVKHGNPGGAGTKLEGVGGVAKRFQQADEKDFRVVAYGYLSASVYGSGKGGDRLGCRAIFIRILMPGAQERREPLRSLTRRFAPASPVGAR
jgi:hypothetical protein